MQKRGYRVKLRGTDISVCPPGRNDYVQNYVRLGRNFGEAYYRQGIMRRMREQGRPKFPEPAPKRPPAKAMKCRGSLTTTPKLTGFRALYVHYLYLTGKIPKNRPRPPSKVHFRYREDLIKIDRISREVMLLCRHRIDTSEQLLTFKTGVTSELEALATQRQALRNSIRRPKDETAVAEVKAQITLLSARMGEIRREVSLCDDIAARSEQFKEKMRQARQEQMQKIEGKEQTQHDKFR